MPAMPTPNDTLDDSRNPFQDQSIAEAIENLYHVFRKYRFTDMNGDVCFPGSCDPAPLLAVPLRQLESKAFETFTFKAITTWGTSNDFRHFLPRMLELAIFDSQTEWEPLERWIIFSKIDYADWRTWPTREQNAIEDLVILVFMWIINQPLHAYDQCSEMWFGNVVHTTDGNSYCESASGFLRDLDNLDTDLTHSLLSRWSKQIEETNLEVPTMAMALAYLELNMNEPVLPRDWYNNTDHIKNLTDAWQRHQDHPQLSTLYSDAHAIAERFIKYGK